MAADVVTMDRIVALCKRRGFVFPSSEIYGGVGSTYDYGHYGVLLKNNVKSQWWKAMLQDRDDIVALDSAIIQHPRVWEASGHLAGFTDPLVDCRACKYRFREDHLGELQCPLKPSKHPGEAEQCDLTEARAFNLMFKTTIGPVEEEGSVAYLRPETAQGIFINFKNVLQFSRKPPRGAKLTWTLSEGANLLIRIERCASKHKCTPHVTVKMHRTVAAGTRSLAFSGRVELRKLRPGGYRFVLDATDLSDNFSDTVYVPFIVAPG